MIDPERLRGIRREQIELCNKKGAEYQPLDFDLKLGVADNFLSGLLPLNGLRHPEESGTSGWYLWAGEEISPAEGFFKPLHAHHLIEATPVIVKYLGLPAGWRFLVTESHEDVWFDEKLLQI